MRTFGGVARENDEEAVLTERGRYMLVVMMREMLMGQNNYRDQARATLPIEERQVLLGEGVPVQTSAA